jgi:methyl-accepting chemotaxis protein
MSLKRLLRLLPLGLVVLVALNLAMMAVQDRQSRATFDQMRVAQVHRDAFGDIRANCEALTFKAVAWTLTRRSTQGRQYQDGKTACFESLSQAESAMPGSGKALGALRERIGQLAALLEAIQLEHTDESKMVTVGRLEREVQPLTAAIQLGFAELTRASDAESEKLMAAALAQQERTLWLGGLAGVLLVGIGALLVHVVTRRILVSVQDAVAVASALADGNLALAPRVRRNDEIGKLLAAMDQARKAWITAIGDINTVTQYIAQAAEGIAHDAASLNQHSIHAAANLQATARSTTELLSMVEESTASARRVAQLAGAATGSAHEGGAAMGEVVRTMDNLSAASSQIGEIVSVIDAIAFQTNLLALNAAVEAARAGEQGRGFAVVAAEVRALAQRSSQAAAQIRELIGASVAGVAKGARSAAGASEKILSVGTAIEQVSAMINDVSGAASRQGREIDQLSRALGEIDHLTQDNTRMVGSWTDRAGELREEVQRLAGLVRRFRLPDAALDGVEVRAAPAVAVAVPVGRARLARPAA